MAASRNDMSRRFTVSSDDLPGTADERARRREPLDAVGPELDVPGRGVGGAQMVRQGQKGYFVGAQVLSQGQHEIKMYWSLSERKLSLDARPVRKLTDYLGALRAVVFCNEDLQLVKGTARMRRRFLDLLLSQTHPNYLPLLQRYMQALRSRNALLKLHG